MAARSVESTKRELSANNMKTPAIETTLYKGKVLVRLFPDSHQYWVSVNGGKVARKSGSTTYIGIKDKSRPLGMWQQRITLDFLLKKIAEGKKISTDLAVEAVIQNEVALDTAVDLGKKIHEWIECYIKNKLGLIGYEEVPPIPDIPEVLQGVNAYLDWETEHKVKYLSSERLVYSKKHDYVGTLDIEAMVDKKRCLIDIKSANGLYNGVLAQTASYVEADTEENGKKYEGRWAIRVSKTTEEEYHRQEQRKTELKQAIAVKQGREVKEYPMKPFKVFEAVYLDTDPGNQKRDFDGFLLMKHLTEWDRATSTFNQE